MARYTGPRCKLMRRDGDLYLLSNTRPLANKCKISKTPGQHGVPQKGSRTGYGVQLRAKQQIRRIYGVLERQFRNYFVKAASGKGATGEVLVQLLESRLDNVVYRMGFAVTRAEARQLVSHTSIMVNSKLVNIPSYHLEPGDIVEVRGKSKNQMRIKAALDLAQQNTLPEWVDTDTKNMSGVFKYAPAIADMPPSYNLNLVVEYYSK